MTDALQALTSWWRFFDYCFNHNPSAMSCEAFWTYGIFGFIGVGVLLLIFTATKIVSDRRKLRAARIAEWERNSVDEAGIREAIWVGESATAPRDASDDQLLATIRAGIEQRKREMNRSAIDPMS